MSIDLKSALRSVLGVVGTVVPAAKGATDELEKILGGSAAANLTPEQEAAISSEIDRHAEAMASTDTEALKAVIQESVAEIQSNDHYVSRARPSGFYAFVVVNLLFAGAVVAGWHPDSFQLEVLAGIEMALGGNSAFYQKLRSDDKAAALAK